MPLTLLLASPEDADADFASGVAGALAVPMIRVPPTELASHVIRHPDRYLLLFGATDAASYRDALHLTHSLVAAGATLPPERLHLIGPVDLPACPADGPGCEIGGFVLRNPIDLELNGRRYGAQLKHILGQGESSDPARSKALLLTRSEDKESALREVEAFAGSYTARSSRIESTIVAAADELLMNAFYDAPTAPDGSQSLAKVPRSTSVRVEADRAVELILSDRDEYLDITVIDRFGSLDRLRVLSHVLRNYRCRQFEIDSERFGAGIGLALTFRKGGSLRFVCVPGKRTEVSVVFQKTRSLKDFFAQFRFLTIEMRASKAE